jgi:hypothetical protein
LFTLAHPLFMFAGVAAAGASTTAAHLSSFCTHLLSYCEIVSQ